MTFAALCTKLCTKRRGLLAEHLLERYTALYDLRVEGCIVHFPLLVLDFDQSVVLCLLGSLGLKQSIVLSMRGSINLQQHGLLNNPALESRHTAQARTGTEI